MLRAGAYRRHIEKRIRVGNRAPPWLRAMTYQPATRTSRSAVPVAVALVAAAVVGALGYESWAGSARPPTVPDGTGASEFADGAVPDGVTVFDDRLPAVANLDADLLDALRRAATAAEDDGVRFTVNSGWRSPRYQDRLLREAIARYGSREAAARWVATPQTSPHVSGDAIDIGPAEATAWLAENGAAYGLCRIYRNEPWHYELRPAAAADGCPRQYADPTRDPRMR